MRWSRFQPGDEIHYYVSTIHAFCLNGVFRRFAWLKPEYQGTVRVLTRDTPDFEPICAYAAAKVNYNRDLAAADYEAFESLSVDAHGRIVGLAANNDMVARAARHFWERAAALGYIDFGMIIYNSYILLRDYPRIASSLCAKYAWFLIDEFQDTTELQIEILKLLYAINRSKFFAVGDLAQSIYGFTGARPELVAPFGVLIQAKSDLSLTGNFRSSEKVVAQAELLFPRKPAMQAVGPDRDCLIEPTLVRAANAFEAITENFLPALAETGICLGDATVLAKDWASLYLLTRGLRVYGTPVVGPGARPYKRSRLFATLAEQLCGAVVDPQPDSNRQLARALFHAVQDITGYPRLEVFSYEGRLIIIRLLNQAKSLADHGGAVSWLDNMAQVTGDILAKAELIDAQQSGLFYASVQEMKADMQKQGADLANLSVEDLGLFVALIKHFGCPPFTTRRAARTRSCNDWASRRDIPAFQVYRHTGGEAAVLCRSDARSQTVDVRGGA